MKRKIIFNLLLALIFVHGSAFGAWDASKPTNNEKLKDTPALIRANWDAIATGTDSALQITNAKVASAAAIVDTKLATIATAGKVDGTALTDLAGVPSGAGALPLLNGGTGQTTRAAAINALLASQTGNSGKAAVTDGTDQSWGYPASISLASQTAGDTMYFNGTLWARLAGGTTGMTYHANGTSAPSWSKVDLAASSNVTGVLGAANGGIGSDTSAWTSGDYLYLSGTGVIGHQALPSSANTSNVLFQYSGNVDSQGASAGEVTGTTLVPSGATGNYRFLQSALAAYTTVYTTKFIKIAGISTVTVYGRVWSRTGAGSQASLKVDIGGQNNLASGTIGQHTPEWVTFTVDVSGLSNGTAYDVTCSIEDIGATGTVYVSNIVGFGS